MSDKANNKILCNLFEEFLNKNKILVNQRTKLDTVRDYLDKFTQLNDLPFFKIEKNDLNEIEIVANTTELFIGNQEYKYFNKLNELCYIDIDSKATDSMEIIVKFIIKED